jgi:hypothetical protein
LLRLDELLEIEQTIAPEHTVAIDPLGNGPQGAAIEGTSVDASFSSAVDQAGLLENAEVLGNRWPRHVEGSGKLADGGVAGRKARENGPSGWVRQRGEGQIKPRVIGNHKVTYIS